MDEVVAEVSMRPYEGGRWPVVYAVFFGLTAFVGLVVAAMEIRAGIGIGRGAGLLAGISLGAVFVSLMRRRRWYLKPDTFCEREPGGRREFAWSDVDKSVVSTDDGSARLEFAPLIELFSDGSRRLLAFRPGEMHPAAVQTFLSVMTRASRAEAIDPMLLVMGNLLARAGRLSESERDVDVTEAATLARDLRVHRASRRLEPVVARQKLLDSDVLVLFVEASLLAGRYSEAETTAQQEAVSDEAVMWLWMCRVLALVRMGKTAEAMTLARSKPLPPHWNEVAGAALNAYLSRIAR